MRIDIRTKILISLLIATCVSLNTNVFVEIALVIFAGVLQLLTDKKAFSYKLISLYILFVIIQFFIFPLVPPVVSMILSMFVVNLRTFIPVLMCIAWIYKTTRISQMMATLYKMHASKGFVIALAIAIRYLPALGEEYRALHNAMCVRNVTKGIINPLKKIKVKLNCYLVPFIISAIKTSDELSAAAMTRGIENPEEPACRNYQPMSVLDFVLIVLTVIFCTACIWMRYGRVR